MKKRVIIFLFLFLTCSFVSSLKINEIELNPAGDDAKNEWIELYSSEEVDLSLYRIKNSDGDYINLTGNFNGYYVYYFEKQWLDNSDEKISLYKSEELIDESSVIKDDKNNDFTWQLCDEWIFNQSTREDKNSCKEEETKKKVKEDSVEEEKSEELNEEEIETKEEIINNTSKVISLNSPKTIKSDLDKEDKGNKYAMYGFAIFCTLLGGLMLFSKRRKTEFE